MELRLRDDIGMLLVGLAMRALGNVSPLLGGKEAGYALGETFCLGCPQGIPWSRKLNVEPCAFYGKLDRFLV